MAGTKTGGAKAASTNKTKHGADFYARIGAMGGKKGRTGGFAANPELARIAGAKGGRISRRGKKAATQTMNIPVSQETTQEDVQLAA
ncbi:MAG: general stress protein [Candidatus Saccharimonadales bacterium]